MTKFEEEFNYLIELSGKVLIGQVDAEAFEKNRIAFFEKYETYQHQALPKTVEDFQGELEDLIDDFLDDYISDLPFDGKKYKFIEKYAPQALSVVPECVGVAIESLPDHCSAFEAISLIEEKIETLPVENEDWLPVYNWLCERVENQDIFALAFITGKYEVEKPQLFYLKNKLTTSYLILDTSTGYFEHWSSTEATGRYKSEFTQQEIGSMQTGSYELVPVEDGE